MKKPLKLLIVEDNPDDAELVLAVLKRSGFDPVWKRVETEPDFLAEIQNSPDIILSDYAMPRFTGLRAAELLKKSGLDIPFILVSGTMGEDIAVEAMKHGASDYLLKDRTARLGTAVVRALEQKQLRDLGRQSELALTLFRNLVDRSSDGIDVVDPVSGRFLDVNQTTCERLGYTREELLTMSVPDIEVPGVAFVSWETFVEEVRQSGSKIMESFQIRKDRSTFPVEVRVRYVTLDRDYLIASVRDITERKRIEQEIQRSEERYRLQSQIQEAILNALPAHIALIDRQGVILRVNQAWRRFAEANRFLSADFGIGKNYLEVCARASGPDAAEASAVVAGIKSVLSGEATEVALEYACHSPSEQRWFRLVVTPLHEQEHRAGAVVMHINITELKLAGEAVRQQLHELQRWHEAMLGREDRILDLKKEVNELLIRQNQPARYAGYAGDVIP